MKTRLAIARILRKEFRVKFLEQRPVRTCIHALKADVTPQMIEDWWFTKMGLLNNEK